MIVFMPFILALAASAYTGANGLQRMNRQTVTTLLVLQRKVGDNYWKAGETNLPQVHGVFKRLCRKMKMRCHEPDKNAHYWERDRMLLEVPRNLYVQMMKQSNRNVALIADHGI
eukprot:GFYU01019550.1.p2 GENE.GFYU01019550.1~~GFYU01019550.1.p2  ORF type:complete len:114 (-),score=2.17 GFYU01019550.1:345-686(-)